MPVTQATMEKCAAAGAHLQFPVHLAVDPVDPDYLQVRCGNGAPVLTRPWVLTKYLPMFDATLATASKLGAWLRHVEALEVDAWAAGGVLRASMISLPMNLIGVSAPKAPKGTRDKPHEVHYAGSGEESATVLDCKPRRKALEASATPEPTPTPAKGKGKGKGKGKSVGKAAEKVKPKASSKGKGKEPAATPAATPAPAPASAPDTQVTIFM